MDSSVCTVGNGGTYLLLSELARGSNLGPHLGQCVRTYVVSCFRNVISHAEFPGVTFRNVICHGNFCKYDARHPWREVLMCMYNPSI